MTRVATAGRVRVVFSIAAGSMARPRCQEGTCWPWAALMTAAPCRASSGTPRVAVAGRESGAYARRARAPRPRLSWAPRRWWPVVRPISARPFGAASCSSREAPIVRAPTCAVPPWARSGCGLPDPAPASAAGGLRWATGFRRAGWCASRCGGSLPGGSEAGVVLRPGRQFHGVCAAIAGWGCGEASAAGREVGATASASPAASVVGASRPAPISSWRARGITVGTAVSPPTRRSASFADLLFGMSLLVSFRTRGPILPSPDVRESHKRYDSATTTAPRRPSRLHMLARWQTPRRPASS